MLAQCLIAYTDVCLTTWSGSAPVLSPRFFKLAYRHTRLQDYEKDGKRLVSMRFWQDLLLTSRTAKLKMNPWSKSNKTVVSSGSACSQGIALPLSLIYGKIRRALQLKVLLWRLLQMRWEKSVLSALFTLNISRAEWKAMDFSCVQMDVQGNDFVLLLYVALEWKYHIG